jgi:hypothetical protein
VIDQAHAGLRRRAADRGQALDLPVLSGHPAEKIAHFAEQQRCDLIVSGHRGRALFDRFRLRSVSRQALHCAHRAVGVVRQQEGCAWSWRRDRTMLRCDPGGASDAEHGSCQEGHRLSE